MCLLLGGLALAGCGNGGDVSAPAPTGTTRADPSAGRAAGGELDPWMAEVCGSVEAVATVANRRNQLDWREVTDPGTATELAAHLRRVEATVGTALAELEAVGAPPVDDGDAVITEVRGGFEERRAALAKAAEFVEGSASRLDPLAAPQIASAAQSAYTAAPRMAREIERQAALRDAYESNPTCSEL